MNSPSVRILGRLCLSVVVTVGLMPMLPTRALATPQRDPMTIRVSASTGNDVTGDGTLAAPYATIEKAMLIATLAGDVVRVAPGTYSPPYTLQIATGVQLIGAGLGRTIVEGIGGPTGPVFRIANGRSKNQYTFRLFT